MNKDVKNIRKTGGQQNVKLQQIVVQMIAEETLLFENLSKPTKSSAHS